MKKEMPIIITALALFLFLPLANAEVNLNPLAKTTYNIGDTIKVNGYVRSAEAGTLPLTIFLSCESGQTKVQQKNLNVIADKDYPISAEVAIPNDLSGKCNIVINFGDEQVSSESFTVSKGLRGTFTLVPLSIQLGDEITITGTVTKLNGDIINGAGVLYLADGEENYLTANVKIENSKFEYTTKIDSIPEGDYQINLAVNDLYGNEELFSNAATLNVYQTIKITATLDKQKYNPDDIIKIKGSVDKTIGTTIEDAEVVFTLDGEEYVSEIIDNKFNYDLSLPSTLKSYEHELSIKVTDEFGNVGEKTLKINIIPNEVKIESGLDKDFFAPKEIVTLKPMLYDQAADSISENVFLVITDSKNKKVVEKQIPTEEEFNFKLSQYAVPGTWSYVLKSTSLTTEGTFTVDTIEDIEVQLQGQVLKIENIGNIKYDSSLLMEVTDSANNVRSVNIKTNLAPGEKTEYQLFKDLKTGTYQVSLPEEGLDYENVNVVDSRDVLSRIGDFFKQATGAAIGAPGTSNDYRPLIYVVLAILAVISVISFKSYRVNLRNQMMRDKEKRIGQQRLQQIQSAPEYKAPKYGKATQADVRDFQQRIMKDIQQNNIRKESPIDSESKTVKSSIERKIVYDRYKRD